MATVSGANPWAAALPVYGDVVGQLAVPVTEHRSQGPCGNGCVDAVDHPRPLVADFLEVVGVPPPHGQS